MADGPALSVKEIATRFGVSTRIVWSWIANGSLKALNCSRSPASKRPTWKVTSAALAEFELARQAIPSQPVTRIRRRRQAAGIIDRY